MKTQLLISFVLSLILSQPAIAQTVLGGSVGNADFEASEPVSGPVNFQNTLHWHNASGDDTINFTQDSQTAGSSQFDSRAGMPFQGRKQVNDLGHTVAAAGEIFSLSYEFGRTGGNWDGDEQMRTFLFTATASVDSNLTTASMTEFAEVIYTFPTNEVWTVFANNAFYVTTLADVGKTFYFGMEHLNPGGSVNVFPRIDLIEWEVTSGGNLHTGTGTFLGGTVGNADFEDSEPDSGALNYANTLHWHNASGDDGINFTQDTQTGGSSQFDSRAGMPFGDRKQVNDLGHLVTAAGEVFNLSYEFGRVGGNWDGDEQMRTFLFTASAAVDASLSTNSMTEFAEVIYTFPTNEFWTVFTANAFYITTPGDVGKVFYFGMNHLNPGGSPNVFPRIDLVSVEVVGAPTNSGSGPIICDALGNADFEVGEPAAVGALSYTDTPHWFNADGGEGVNFTQDSQTGGSSQTNSRAGMPFQDRKQFNDTGHTVASAGEVFSLSYDFGRGGGGWDGDEQMRTFLFTSSAPVDGDLTPLEMNEFAEVIYTFPTNVQWTSFSSNAFYTTVPGDVGDTFYLGMEHLNPSGDPVYPRIDVICWSVVVPGVTSGPPPAVTNTPTGWENFVALHGLSGDLWADDDQDGVHDFYEFAHGGNPTNALDAPVPPQLLPISNDVASFVTVESTNDNPGVYYAAEWTDDLVNGPWMNLWDSTNGVPAVPLGFDLIERQIAAGSLGEMYVRNRVSPAPHRPNILFIFADDLGYADVGFNGSPDILTPNLDELADRGTIFSSAYVVHPFCGPSRMGLFSGRYPHEFGGPYNLPGWQANAYRDEGIPTNQTLFSSVLQDAGYHTGLIGKWHMGVDPQFHPNARGFDHFYGFLGGGKNYFGPYVEQTGNVNDYRIYPEENQVDDETLTASDYITDVLSSKGVEFIQAAATNSAPFFLFMSYNAPHTPLEARAEDMAVFPGLTGDRLTYAGMVYALDRGVGALVDALENTGQLDDTLIVFLSDNGGRTDAGGSNAPLRGGKGDAWEGGFRVPMLMHWPQIIKAGETNDYPVSALDFYPTFARLANAAVPESQELDGKDLLESVLFNTNARSGEPIYAVRYRIGSGPNGVTDVGIRQDQWKASRVNSTWQLFNIETDIGESTDVSGANAAVLSNLVEAAEIWAQDHIRPLFFDSLQAESDWDSQNMPRYGETFSIP